MCEPLMRRRDGRAIPALIDAWEFGDDGRSMLLTVRQGARFHDGSPCTAEDILRTLEIVRDAKDAFGMQGAYARYLGQLGLAIEKARPATYHQPGAGRQPARHLLRDLRAQAGCGRPTHHRDRSISHRRICGWRLGEAGGGARPGRGMLYDTLTVLEIPEAEDRYQALESGQVDLATGLEHLRQDTWWGEPGVGTVQQHHVGALLPQRF